MKKDFKIIIVSEDAHYEQVAALLEKEWREHAEYAPDIWSLSGGGFDTGWLKRDRICIAALSNQKIIATLILSLRTVPGWIGEAQIEYGLEDIFVDESFRESGLAQALLDRAMLEFQDSAESDYVVGGEVFLENPNREYIIKALQKIGLKPRYTKLYSSIIKPKAHLNDIKFSELVEAAEHVLIVQAENPDGDSVASSLALETLIGDNFPQKKVTMFCKLPVPAHLRYFKGWDRVVQDLPNDFDLVLLVDCAEQVLLEKTLRSHGAERFQKAKCVVLDHHQDKINLPFETLSLIDVSAVSAGAVIFNLAKKENLKVSKEAAEFILSSILSDTLGLSLDFVRADDFRTVAELTDLGASVARIENGRRELNKRPQFITKYKAELLGRVEYLLDGRLAYVQIPWEDIEQYSGIYNPPILVFEDMRLTEGVQIVMAVKVYKNGKMTAKIRTNPGYEVADRIAAKFGCGGHPGSAGCKVEPGMYRYDEFKSELVKATEECLGSLEESTRSKE